VGKTDKYPAYIYIYIHEMGAWWERGYKARLDALTRRNISYALPGIERRFVSGPPQITIYLNVFFVVFLSPTRQMAG
jgi:hypothetical protein